MPIYEYSCKSCGHKFEELVFSDDDEKKLLCPECKSDEIKRVVSSFAATTAKTILSGGGCGTAGGG